MVTLDRTSAEHALLILDNGDAYDVYGMAWSEIKAEGVALADSLGVKIEVFNANLPE